MRFLSIRIVLYAVLISGRCAAFVSAADYFVSAEGDDAHEGTTLERAWQSVSRAGRQALRPGDRLLFRGGDVFDGSLTVQTSGAATADSPITIGSYGDAKAVLHAGNEAGVSIENSGGVVVRDLVVEGASRRTNRGSGVSILNTLAGGQKLEHVRIENVEAKGFGKYGIAVGGWPADQSQSGFRDVLIVGCSAADNAYAGIHVYGVHDYYAKTYAHRDVAIVDCVAHDNPGDPDFLDNHSGNGILLHDVDGGRVEGCMAFGNGGECRAKSGGPVGIWAWSCRRLVIQKCVSVRNRTGGKYDGGGFDFDGGVSESILQYNYSAENDGAGYLVFDFGAAPFRLADNVVRFNISENDGRKNGYAGVFVKSLGEPVERLHILHNTIYVGSAEGPDRPAAVLIDKTKDCRVHNNLLMTSGGCALADMGAENAGLQMLGNHYWAGDDPFRVRHAGKDFDSLAAWRQGAGVERRDGRDHGAAGDPRLNGRLPGPLPKSPRELGALIRFRLRPDSPLRNAGFDLSKMFALEIGDKDFWGQTLPSDRPVAVGADGASER